MGQKINPISLRLQYTNRHFDPCWYSSYYYKTLVVRDLFLKTYLTTFLNSLHLGAGRYSIQHFQKSTTLYNFFCDSKSTRDWRSTLFGLVKKKHSSRYFFKKSLSGKKKKVKLSFFALTRNQLAVEKLKKKITSFQNLTLWSTGLNQRAVVTSSFSPFSLACSLKNQRVPETARVFTKSEVLKKQPLSKTETTHSSDLLSLQNKRHILENLFVYRQLKTGTSQSSFAGFHCKYQNCLSNSLSSFYKTPLTLLSFKVVNDWQNAGYLADQLVYFLEKRVSFRALKTKIVRHVFKNAQIRGIRITCSGRVGGKSKKAQRAKTECMKYGETSLQVFSSKLDFAARTAFTSFGSVGVKVWICYN